MYSTKNKNTNFKKNRKNKLFYAILAVCVFALILFGLEYTNRINLYGNEKDVNKTDANSLSVNGSTESTSTKTQDNEQTEEVVSGNPKNISEQSNTTQSANTNNQSQKKSVTPILVNTSSDFVSGYITGIVEDRGICTFTFTGNGTIIKTSKSIENVSTTDCSVTPPKGNGWSVVLSYDSKTASGKSQKAVVN